MSGTLSFSQQQDQRFPLWLRRWHSWWFLGQVLANVTAVFFVMPLIRGNGDWPEFGIGLLLGQGFLLSVWMALGGLPNVMRFVAVLLVTFLAGLAVSDLEQLRADWGEWIVETGQIFVVCFFMVVLFHALLLPLRGLLGWRLDFDPAYHAPERNGRMQIGITHILGWMTFLAVPFALFRLLSAIEFNEVGMVCLQVSAMTLPLAAACSLAMMGRRKLIWVPIGAIVFGLTWLIEPHIPDLVIDQNFFLFNLGIAAAILSNLLLLKLFGLQLFSVAEQPVADVAVTKNSLPQPHFAPEVRKRGVAMSSGS